MTKGLYDKKDGELSYQAIDRFAKETTKEGLAEKIIKIIQWKDFTDFEVISQIDYLCRSVLGKE